MGKKSQKTKNSSTCNQDGYSKFRTRWRHVLLIDQKIRSGQPVNCTTLSAELEVSRRTILRDMDFLKCDLNAPIAFDAAHNRYVYTEPNWNLPNLRLTEGELFALMVAEKALEAYVGTPWAQKLQQIFGRMAASLPDRVEITPQALLPRITFGQDAPAIVDPANLETLSQAIRENKTLQMSYFALNRGEVRTYVIDPYLLRQSRGAWYLAAREHASGRIPLFNLSRIKVIKPTGDVFDYDASDFDPEKYFQGTFSVQESPESYRILIEFSGYAAQLIRERQWHHSQKLKELSKDRLRFELEISSLWDILPWILSWGSEAKVLGPKELVQMVKKQALDMTKQYSGSQKKGTE
jgi:proteasome accessory factor B